MVNVSSLKDPPGVGGGRGGGVDEGEGVDGGRERGVMEEEEWVMEEEPRGVRSIGL